MSFENIILTGIVIVLAFVLFRYSDKPAGKTKKMLPQHKIRFVSEKTGEVIEMHLIDTASTSKKQMNEESFLANAKIAFQLVVDSFTKGDLQKIKNLVVPDIYTAFEKEVAHRKENNQIVDFSLICFDSVKILNSSTQKEEITVQFVTEQINLLKDKDGNVIEGDEMSVATVTDTWTFRKKNASKWIVSATKSGAVNG